MTDKAPTQQRYDFDRVVRIVIGVAVVVALIWLLRVLSDVLIPFAVAVLLAYLINPIVTLLQRKVRNRAAATLITVFGLLVVLIAIVMMIVPMISGEVASFGQMIQQMNADAQSLPDKQTVKNRFNAYIESQDSELYKRLLVELRTTIAGMDVESLKAHLIERVGPGLWSLVSGALSFLLGLTGMIIVLLYLVFVLIDYAALESQWRGYLPPKYRDRIIGFVDEFSHAMSRYFRGQFIIAGIVGILFAVGFSIIGLRLGILLGFLIGVVNMVPYLQTVCVAPALLLGVMRAIEHGTSVAWSLALVLLVFAVIQALQDGVLVPWIMGRQTGLRPVALLLSVFVWGKLLGFLGLVLAIPLTCLAVAWYRRAVLGQRDAQAIPKTPDA